MDDQDQAWKNVLEALRKACKQQKISFDPSLQAIKDRLATLLKNFLSENWASLKRYIGINMLSIVVLNLFFYLFIFFFLWLHMQDLDFLCRSGSEEDYTCQTLDLDRFSGTHGQH